MGKKERVNVFVECDAKLWKQWKEYNNINGNKMGRKTSILLETEILRQLEEDKFKPEGEESNGV